MRRRRVERAVTSMELRRAWSRLVKATTCLRVEFEKDFPAMVPTDRDYDVLAVLNAVSRDIRAGPRCLTCLGRVVRHCTWR